jgi:glutamate-1-semialdehyde 2,1-aminomutase
MKIEDHNLTESEKLARRARSLIPGGAHTYSKGDDQFPSNAPKLIDHGKGCELWDVEGNCYLDLAMSLGTVLLGHAYEPVLDAVREELSRGVNFVRPSVIEGELAELLVEVIPSAEMVKFSKNGSDATTAAVKLARAYTGRDYVARCADDPFNSVHDWFIGSTIMSRGVPERVQELTLKFEYNKIDSIQALIDQFPDQIACVLLEPVSFMEPQANFLENLKGLCDKHGIVLIFDEVVSGFRFALGGAQEMVGVTPHLSAFGKGMANGFALSALVGQREIMQLGGLDHEQERVFLLSTTHGGETHSIAAAIKTIQDIRDLNAIDHFANVGASLKHGILEAARAVGAESFVSVSGYDCKPSIVVTEGDGKATPDVRTLFLQETVARGLLVPYIVPSYAHKQDSVDRAINIMAEALKVVKEAIETETLVARIQGPSVKPVFRKFN